MDQAGTWPLRRDRHPQGRRTTSNKIRKAVDILVAKEQIE
ncbi:hypothetical protein ACVIM5_005795 [Bradyrhizobium sp. USDA 4512]|nr:hypothetical protein [Bradyrhizobium sp. USDA 4539]